MVSSNRKLIPGHKGQRGSTNELFWFAIAVPVAVAAVSPSFVLAVAATVAAAAVLLLGIQGVVCCCCCC